MKISFYHRKDAATGWGWFLLCMFDAAWITAVLALERHSYHLVAFFLAAVMTTILERVIVRLEE